MVGARPRPAFPAKGRIAAKPHRLLDVSQLHVVKREEGHQSVRRKRQLVGTQAPTPSHDAMQGLSVARAERRARGL